MNPKDSCTVPLSPKFLLGLRLVLKVFECLITSPTIVYIRLLILYSISFLLKENHLTMSSNFHSNKVRLFSFSATRLRRLKSELLSKPKFVGP